MILSISVAFLKLIWDNHSFFLPVGRKKKKQHQNPHLRNSYVKMWEQMYCWCKLALFH